MMSAAVRNSGDSVVFEYPACRESIESHLPSSSVCVPVSSHVAEGVRVRQSGYGYGCDCDCGCDETMSGVDEKVSDCVCGIVCLRAHARVSDCDCDCGCGCD